MNLKTVSSLSFIKQKFLRRLVRIIVAFFVLYLLVLTALSIYITSSRERLITFLNSQIKETILGEFKLNKADITVWQTFPKLGVTLENVTISDSFYHTPFLKADAITAKAGIFDLLGSKVTISSVKIKNAMLHTFTDSNGYTNSYVLRSHPVQKEKRESKKPFVIRNIDLQNVSVIIEDVPQKKRFMGRINDGDIDMRLTGQKYHVTFKEDLFLHGLGFSMRQGYWLENQRIHAKWKIEFDTAKNTLFINQSDVKIGGHPFKIDGKFDFDSSIFNINASTKDANYGKVITVLKPKTRTLLQKINLTQPVDASVALNGSLSKKGDPVVMVNYSTKKSGLTTPVINLNECTFSGSFTNQVNKNIEPDDSNSRVQLNSFISYWGSIALRGKNIAITNLDKPVIQFEFGSQCNFQQLDEALSSDVLHFVEGNAKLYLAYNGPLIADPSLLDQLNAKIQIQNGKVEYIPRNLTFSECNGTVALIGNNLNVNNLQCNLNANHFEVNINGTNLNRISGKEEGKAVLNCSVVSPSVDLSDFKALFAAKETKKVKRNTKGMAKTANAIDNAVENGDVFINLKAQQLSLNNFKASNANAVLLFTDNDWEVKKAFVQFADGSFNLAAKVKQTGTAAHSVNMQLDLQHINVKKLFYGFDNFGLTSLTYKNINGVMNSKANITAAINGSGKFVPSSVNGKMYFSLRDASLVNFAPLLEVQKIALKNRNLNNVQFAEIKDTFDIQNGDIYIHRMPIQSSAITMNIEGIYSFTDKTDISIQVPLSNLKNRSDEEYDKVNKERLNKPGASIYLRAKEKNGQVKIGLDVFRKFRKNKNGKD